MNVTVFASPLVLENDVILLAGESGILLLIEPDSLTVLRRCQLAGGKIVKAPQVVGSYLFVMLTSG